MSIGHMDDTAPGDNPHAFGIAPNVGGICGADSVSRLLRCRRICRELAPSWT